MAESLISAKMSALSEFDPDLTAAKVAETSVEYLGSYQISINANKLPGSRPTESGTVPQPRRLCSRPRRHWPGKRE
jgi:hypothetical protein